MKTTPYTQTTEILDYHSLSITQLISDSNWLNLNEFERIGAIYAFVKNSIKFGYNRSDDIKASDVLNDGYGQCNTKSTLLMALLRATGTSCRFHGFTINKRLQKGAIPTYLYWLAPRYILHSWVEVFYNNHWINLEGFILDKEYLAAIQQKFSNTQNTFCGYGIATPCLSNPPVNWTGQDTYIQRDGIHHDFGLFNSPDEFYAKHGTNLSGLRRLLYVYFIRHLINMNIMRLRRLKG